MAELPSGDVTFVLTDIERSTPLLRRLGPDRYEAILALQADAIAEAITRHNGASFKNEGDAVLSAFRDPERAIAAAVDIQRNLQSVEWPDGADVRVRVGLHRGGARVVDGDYVSLALHQATRVIATAHGGQIVATTDVTGVLPDGVSVMRLGAFQIRDFEIPVDLVEIRHPDLPTGFPPPRAQTPASHNIPVARTVFFGRRDEIEELSDLVAAHRCVAIVGPSGVGKTRLSFEFASRSVVRFADGAWAVQLGTVDDEEAIVSVTADVLGVSEDGDLFASVLTAASELDALLVFDNCEHVLDAATRFMARLLDASPKLRIVATSRSPIRLTGAQQYRMSSLEPRSSIELFNDRARLSDLRFHPGVATEPYVRAIVDAVDGLPLAIELMAARVGTMGLEELASHLPGLLALAADGDPSLDERQRSLRAAIEWSYRLLDEDEQKLFRRVSVFRGGWPAGATEAVCASDDLPPSRIASLEANLIDASLVSVDSVTARHRLIASVREFADDLLDGAERVDVRQRHADWVLKTIAPDAAERVRIDDDYANVRAALASDADADTRARILTESHAHWKIHGWMREWFASFDLLSEAILDPRTRIALLLNAAHSDQEADRIDRAFGFLDQATALLDDLDERRRPVPGQRIGHTKANLLIRVGRLEEAREVLSDLEIPTDPDDRAAFLNTQGLVSFLLGDESEALALWRQMADIGTYAACVALGNMAEVYFRRGDDRSAWILTSEHAEVALHEGSADATGKALELFGQIAVRNGSVEVGVRLISAGHHVLELAEITLYDSDKAALDETIATAKAILGDEAFNRVWLDGRALDAAELLRETATEPPPEALRP